MSGFGEISGGVDVRAPERCGDLALDSNADVLRAAMIRIGEFILDPERFELRSGQAAVRLQPKTFDVLAFLVANPGRIVKDELVAAVWPGVIVTENSLARCIKDLRKALGDDVAHPRYIETVARRGYRLLVTPEPLPPGHRAPVAPNRRRFRLALLMSCAALAAAVVAAMALKLAPMAEPAQVPAAVEPRATGFEAYQQFKTGREYLDRRPVGWRRSALAAFDRAVELDPAFASAHAGKAIAEALVAITEPAPGAGFARARASTERALALEPRLALAHAARGLVLLEGDRDPKAAEGALRAAIALDPAFTNSYNWLQIALNFQGRRAEALAVVDAGLRMDPLNPVLLQNRGASLAAEARFDEARAAFERLLTLPDRPAGAYIGLFQLHLAHGRLAEALDYALRMQREVPGNRRASMLAGLAYARLGMPTEANQHLDAATARPPYAGALPALEAALRTLGRAHEVEGFAKPFLQDPGAATWSQRSVGRVAALSGDPEAAVARLAPIYAADDHDGSGGWGGDVERIDGRLAYIHALRRAGRGADADAQLAKLLDAAALARTRGLGDTPHERYLRAMALTLAGRQPEALGELERAVKAGWNDHATASADPRWQALGADPRFRNALATAAESVARQREMVTARSQASSS